jgi:putative oxidoreductase
MTFLDKWAPYWLSVLRIVTSLLFLEHGLEKLFGFPVAGPALSPLVAIQAVIEVFGGAALLVGVYARPVAFVLCGDMAVAYFMAHFPRSFYPIVNGGDAAVLYCFVFFYIVLAGAGPWSVDDVVLKRP